MRTLHLCLALGALLTAPLSASATIIIDDFETGAFDKNASGQIEHLAPGALGGVRWVNGSSNDMSLTLSAGDDAASIYVSSIAASVCCMLGYDGSLDGGYLTTFPPGMGSVDLTEGGANDRFRVSFSDLPDDVLLQIGFRYGSTVVWGPDTYGAVHLVSAGSSFYEVHFSDFAVLPTDVNGIRLGFAVPGGGVISTIGVTRFAVVPEPSTGLLLSLGLFAISAARRGPKRA